MCLFFLSFFYYVGFQIKTGKKLTWFPFFVLAQQYNSTGLFCSLNFKSRTVDLLGSGSFTKREWRLPFKIKITWLAAPTWYFIRLSRVCPKKTDDDGTSLFWALVPVLSPIYHPPSVSSPFSSAHSLHPKDKTLFLIEEQTETLPLSVSVSVSLSLSIYIYT